MICVLEIAHHEDKSLSIQEICETMNDTVLVFETVISLLLVV